jgi:N-acyl-D-amino-acid deacylase
MLYGKKYLLVFAELYVSDGFPPFSFTARQVLYQVQGKSSLASFGRRGEIMYDLVIRGGKIIDGIGNPWFRGDVAVEDGRIVEISRLRLSGAERTIEADGLIVCPGFIDMHSHSDLSVFFNPKLESSIRQGITTSVVGNCGLSLAPINPERKALLIKEASSILPICEKLRIDWTGFDEYLSKLEKTEISKNLAPLVGHGTVRIAVMGLENRDPTCEEMAEMKRLVAEAMEAGAFGLSSGLIYSPGVFSKTDELVELCKVVAKYGGIYASHIRSERARLIEAVKEAISIGEKAGVPVQISHHKAAGRHSWGRTTETLRLMEEARARGVDVTCDQYPYRAGMTSLSTLLPPWVHEGGVDEMLKRLRSPEDRERIRKEIKQLSAEWENLAADCGWENIYVSSVRSERNRHLEGRSMAEIAEIRGEDEFTALCNLLVEEEGRAAMVIFIMDEQDIRRVMKSRLQMFGTDSWASAPFGDLRFGKPHPRFYGTYPRVLGRYVRDEKVLTLEEAVRKMTSFPAQKLGLTDRGLLKPGMWADIVVFDPEKIRDTATYSDPHRYSEGIECVIVNGEIVIEKEEHIGVSAGKVLRRESAIKK